MTPARPRKLYVKTFGCQMNAYDSERMAESLRPLGYGAAERPDEADLVILNTCHIREKAAEKVYSELGQLRALKDARAEAGGRMRIAVAGCVAQAEGEEVRARAPYVDFVLGPQTYHRLPELITRADREEGGAVEIDLPVDEKFDRLPEARARGGPARFLTIHEGCDKFCAFCVVPYTRGAEWSRPVDQIVAEARALVRAGAREITLLGQNVNAYHGAPPSGAEADGVWGLGRLVRHLAKIDRLDRIRFTTSHPRDMDDDLIAALGDETKLMPYLHLPVQAGSDKILKAMNRGHTAEDYVRLIEKVRAARPDIAISGDFIVGFPGEKEADFEDTLALVREVTYASAYSFKYSKRPGTPAAAAFAQVAEDVKADRLARLQALLDDQRRSFNASCVGVRLPILFEKRGRKDGQLIGRSPYLQSVHALAPDALLGAIVEAEITAAKPNSLEGRLVAKAAAA